jgi:hypothetical protein
LNVIYDFLSSGVENFTAPTFTLLMPFAKIEEQARQIRRLIWEVAE